MQPNTHTATGRPPRVTKAWKLAPAPVARLRPPPHKLTRLFLRPLRLLPESAARRGGAKQLAHIAAGWNADEGWGARCQAAAFLHFCLSRVKIDDDPEDAPLVAQLPALINVLRAACVPLLATTRGEENKEDPPDQRGSKRGGGGATRGGGKGAAGGQPPGAKTLAASKSRLAVTASLLRDMLGALWGMCAALRAAGKPLPPTSGLLGLLLALLEEAPPPPLPKGISHYKAGNLTAAEAQAKHAAAVRCAALGTVACLDLRVAAIEADLEQEAVAEHEADSHVKEMEALRVRQWTKDEEDAVRRLQAHRRGQLGRRDLAARRASLAPPAPAAAASSAVVAVAAARSGAGARAAAAKAEAEAEAAEAAGGVEKQEEEAPAARAKYKSRAVQKAEAEKKKQRVSMLKAGSLFGGRSAAKENTRSCAAAPAALPSLYPHTPTLD